MGGHGARIDYRRGKMTMQGAARKARRLWSGPGEVGIVRRRRTSPRFIVGICYDDGRPAITKGTSNVDWESAFYIAAMSEPITCKHCGEKEVPGSEARAHGLCSRCMNIANRTTP